MVIRRKLGENGNNGRTLKIIYHKGISGIKNAYFTNTDMLDMKGIKFAAVENNGHGLRILAPKNDIKTPGTYSYRDSDIVTEIISTPRGLIPVCHVDIIQDDL